MRAWDYPNELVIVACTACKRRGQYSKDRFIELVGRDTSLSEALRIIAASCPKASGTHSIGYDSCAAQYDNL